MGLDHRRLDFAAADGRVEFRIGYRQVRLELLLALPPLHQADLPRVIQAETELIVDAAIVVAAALGTSSQCFPDLFELVLTF
ncbi:MAG: hypothetical protein AAGI88_24265 [Pseudomonadota bacterium]